MKYFLLLLVSTFACLISSNLQADEYHDHHAHDHDHTGHQHNSEPDHAKSSGISQDEISEWLAERGLQMVRVESRTIHGRDVIAVPFPSIVEDKGRYFILALNSDVRGLLDTWEVTIGQSDGKYVEARTGVFPGDFVVVKKDHRGQVPSISCGSCQLSDYSYQVPARNTGYSQCDCSNCSTSTAPQIHSRCQCSNQAPVNRHSESVSPSGKSGSFSTGYEEGFKAGYQSGITKRETTSKESDHEHCDCDNCPSSESDDLVFRKNNANDPSSGYFVPSPK